MDYNQSEASCIFSTLRTRDGSLKMYQTITTDSTVYTVIFSDSVIGCPEELLDPNHNSFRIVNVDPANGILGSSFVANFMNLSPKFSAVTIDIPCSASGTTLFMDYSMVHITEQLPAFSVTSVSDITVTAGEYPRLAINSMKVKVVQQSSGTNSYHTRVGLFLGQDYGQFFFGMTIPVAPGYHSSWHSVKARIWGSHTLVPTHTRRRGRPSGS